MEKDELRRFTLSSNPSFRAKKPTEFVMSSVGFVRLYAVFCVKKFGLQNPGFLYPLCIPNWGN